LTRCTTSWRLLSTPSPRRPREHRPNWAYKRAGVRTLGRRSNCSPGRADKWPGAPAYAGLKCCCVMRVTACDGARAGSRGGGLVGVRQQLAVVQP
jgi:hypothetical protein